MGILRRKILRLYLILGCLGCLFFEDNRDNKDKKDVDIVFGGKDGDHETQNFASLLDSRLFGLSFF